MSEIDRRAQVCFERFQRAREAVQLHATLFGDRSPSKALQPALASLDESWQQLRKVGGDAKDAVARMTAIEQATASLEAAVLKADGTVSTAFFRQAFSEDKVAYDGIVRYVQLLAEKLVENAERRDRIDFLSTRLLSSPTPSGAKQMIARSAADATLKAISMGRTARPDVKSGSAKHFQETIQKFMGLTSVDEAFDSGLLLDLRGYKVTLGPDLVDPDVLYASCALNVEIANRLDVLMKEEGLEPAAIGKRYAELDRKLKEIFRDDERSFRVPEPQKFTPVKKPAEKSLNWNAPIAPERKSKDLHNPDAPAHRQKFLVALLVMVVLAASSWWVWSWVHALDPEISPVGPLEIQGLGLTDLKNPQWAYNAEGTGIYGELTVDWNGMSESQRHEYAEKMAQRFRDSGWTHGQLLEPGGKSIAFRIRNGQLTATR